MMSGPTRRSSRRAENGARLSGRDVVRAPWSLEALETLRVGCRFAA
jgi:hypothetical protein